MITLKKLKVRLRNIAKSKSVIHINNQRFIANYYFLKNEMITKSKPNCKFEIFRINVFFTFLSQGFESRSLAVTKKM
jgi:hypothetical protein